MKRRRKKRSPARVVPRAKKRRRPTKKKSAHYGRYPELRLYLSRGRYEVSAPHAPGQVAVFARGKGGEAVALGRAKQIGRRLGARKLTIIGG